MAAVVAADLHQSSRSLGCCSCRAWQAEGRCHHRCHRYRRYRYHRHRCYRYHHRGENSGLVRPPVALARLALARLALARLEGLAEAADRFRQG